MGKTYRAYLPEQKLLLPPSLQDWLPESHLVYFVSDVVDQLDLSAIESVYEKEWRGQPPYHPRLMVKLLLYGYCLGVRSSRKIASVWSKTWRFECWRLATSPTSAPSRISARSTSQRWNNSSNRCCGWPWKQGR